MNTNFDVEVAQRRLNAQIQRWESDAEDIEFVSERDGWLPLTGSLTLRSFVTVGPEYWRDFLRNRFARAPFFTSSVNWFEV